MNTIKLGNLINLYGGASEIFISQLQLDDLLTNDTSTSEYLESVFETLQLNPSTGGKGGKKPKKLKDKDRDIDEDDEDEVVQRYGDMDGSDGSDSGETGGVLGFFGLEKEKEKDIKRKINKEVAKVPEETIGKALTGQKTDGVKQKLKTTASSLSAQVTDKAKNMIMQQLGSISQGSPKIVTLDNELGQKVQYMLVPLPTQLVPTTPEA